MTVRLITASVFLSAMAACGGASPAPRAPAPAEPAPPTSVIVAGEPGTGDDPAAMATAEPPVSEPPAAASTTDCDVWLDAAPIDDAVVDDAYARGIVELGADLRRLDPALLAFFLDHLDGWPARGARVVPSIKNGAPNGVKLYAIRDGSVYARLGFANGDTLHTLNGTPMEVGNARCTLLGLRGAATIEAKLTRRGKPLTLRFDVR